MTDSVRILYVDDDPDFAELTAEMLERKNSNFSVTTFTDSKKVLDFLQSPSGDIDCLVTDYQMPELNGIELVRLIGTRYPDRQLPCILFTGEGSEDVAADALHAGATSYVQKGGPDTFEYLIERIQRDIQSAYARQDSIRFGALSNALDDPLYVLDGEGEFVYANDAFVEFTGYDHGTIIGSSPSLVKSDASVERGENHLGQILSDDGPDSVAFEIDIQTIDGQTITCEDHMGVLPYEGDTFQGSIGTLRDISEKKAREQAIQEAKNRYQTLVEQNIVGLYIAREGKIIYHNDPFAEIFGYEEDDNHLAGRDLADFVTSDDRQRLRTTLNETEYGDRDSIREPYIGIQSNNDPVQIELLARGIELEEATAVIGTVIDTNEDVTEISQLRAEVNRLEEFTGIVSHDLRNPLTVAMGRADILASETDANEHTEVLNRSLERMEAIIDDLLTLASGGDAIGTLESVGLRTVAAECWELVATPDAEIVFSIDTDYAVQADRSRLKQLFENLLRNAIEHGGADVTVTIGDLDNGFYIADDGAGIDSDVIDQIFTPGYSTDSSGTGFGLSIVNQIVVAHGWNIECCKSENGGARFEVTGIEYS